MSDNVDAITKNQLEGRVERLKFWTQALALITAFLVLVSTALGLFVKNQSEAKQQAQTHAEDLTSTVDSLRKQNASLQAENSSLKSQLQSQAPPTTASSTGTSPAPTAVASPLKQVLGTDIKASSTTGNEWHLEGPGSVNGQSYDQVVSMGWCSGCLDSETNSGFAEFNLGSRSSGTLETTVGQNDKSADSTGRFRFEIQLDGVSKFSQVLPFGTSVPVKIPLQSALRVRFVVTLVGNRVNAITSFADPTVTSP